jgi:hypothetical protein
MGVRRRVALGLGVGMTYPQSADTFSDLVKVARRVIDRQSGSMAEDAIVLARWILAADEAREDPRLSWVKK